MSIWTLLLLLAFFAMIAMHLRHGGHGGHGGHSGCGGGHGHDDQRHDPDAIDAIAPDPRPSEDPAQRVGAAEAHGEHDAHRHPC